MATSRSPHVVLFPFPGHGHLAGFIAIAHLLRQELPDATVTLVSTPRNVATLRASAADSSIGFHALPFVPSDHGLPAGCESIGSLPETAFIDFFEAIESLEPAFDAYISGLVRDGAAKDDVCVIADAFCAWTVDAARRHGCAHAMFASCGAFGTAVFHALWKSITALPFSSDERWTAFYHRLIPHGYRTDAVLVNTVDEFEPTGLALMRRTLGKIPVWPIGPLVRVQDTKMASSSEIHDDGVLRWLDSQPPASVLYISFGSQNTIQQEQMMELAEALESTGRPFVWVIRPPVGFDIAGEFRDEWLPEGFEERARAGNRGVLVRGWAPQLRILAHGATGAFLSHCGWNSVLESLSRGVPIIGWPLAGEQFYNAMMLAEEWGVCVEVACGNQLESSTVEQRPKLGQVLDMVKGGTALAAAMRQMESFTVERSKLAQVLDTVMGETASAATMRQQVAVVREKMKSAWAEDGGSSRMELHEFLRAMHLK
ncbi:hypothetical protein EJB05_05639, partial [Eragrostis curvula]